MESYSKGKHLHDVVAQQNLDNSKTKFVNSSNPAHAIRVLTRKTPVIEETQINGVGHVTRE